MNTRTRTHVAAVCYCGDAQLRVLLVRTKGDRFWVFPKGGVRKHERPFEAAAREAREEAGVLGRVDKESFASFDYCAGNGESHTLDAFLLEVENPHHLLPPEHEARRPTWFTFDEAIAALREHREPVDGESLVNIVATANRLLRPQKWSNQRR